MFPFAHFAEGAVLDAPLDVPSDAPLNAPFDLRFVSLAALRDDSRFFRALLAESGEKSARTLLLLTDAERVSPRFLQSTLAELLRRDRSVFLRSDALPTGWFAESRLTATLNRPGEMLERSADGRICSVVLFDRSLGRWMRCVEPCAFSSQAPDAETRLATRLETARVLDRIVALREIY